jgi:methionyl-tRNA formyltransferase
LKTLFFGTSEFAVPSLHVAAERTQLAGVVTQPDRPAGRGHKLSPTPLKEAALGLGLRVYEPQKLRPFIDEIRGEAFDLFALASYGKILPQALLDLPRLGALNVHPSLLPKYRGATPIQTAIANGDAETGVSIMLMDAGMDTGDLVLQERVEIDPAETYGELHDRLAMYGGELLGRALDLAEAGPLPRTPQQGEPSVTKPLRKEDLWIDWSWPAQRIVDRVRSLSPQPGARASMLAFDSLKLLKAHVYENHVAGDTGRGILIGKEFVVPCGHGAVVVDELIAPNRGRESGVQFVTRAAAVQS